MSVYTVLDSKMKMILMGITNLPFLLLAGPFVIRWDLLDRLLTYDLDRSPYIPLIWPGTVAIAGVAVIAASRMIAHWPARRFTLWFNAFVVAVATFMSIEVVVFALNPT